jgi:hypothetical protein
MLRTDQPQREDETHYLRSDQQAGSHLKGQPPGPTRYIRDMISGMNEEVIPNAE